MAVGDKIHYTLILNGPEDSTTVTIFTDSKKAYETLRDQFRKHVVYDSYEQFLSR